jgi:hypothetical protein
MKSSIGLSFSLIDSQSEITQKILNAIFPQVEKYFDSNINQLVGIIPKILIQHITNQPEYLALTQGTLQYELGIPDPQSRMEEILETIKSGVIVKKKPVSIKSSSISGGIKIQMIKKDFKDLLSLGASSIITEKGSQLNWLQWLLLEGDSIIVSDHIFLLGPSRFSRTGFGLMKENSGGFWRVPPEYAGNINNNWITRSITSAVSEIDAAIEKILKY